MNFGAYAEYIRIPANYFVSAKPSNISFEEAATIPTGEMNALHVGMLKAQTKQGMWLS